MNALADFLGSLASPNAAGTDLTAAPAVDLVVGLDLDELARRIRCAHHKAEMGFRQTLAAAMDAGDLLIEAKRRLPHGAFLPWLAEHVGLSRQQTARYMRVARGRERLSNVSPETHLTAGLRLLAPPNATEPDLDGDLADPVFLRRPGDGPDDWGTPAKYIEAARLVLGGIDLDPASCPKAQARVRAARFHTADDDGLVRLWRGRVWLNPPYAADLVGPFVAKLLAEHATGNVPAAVLLVHARPDTEWFHAALRGAAAVCFTRGRIPFLLDGEPVRGNPDGSVFFYLGRDVEAFGVHFDPFGTVVVPAETRGRPL